MSLPELDARRRIAVTGFDYETQPKREVVLCNLCAGSDFVVVAERDRYGYPARATGCVRCGLVFLNPVMTAAAYRDFYARVYRPLVSAYHGRRIDARSIQEEQRAYAAQRADFLAPWLESRRPRTLLDAGGSTGVVAEHLSKRFGLRATVLDPSPDELAEARRRGMETILGFLEEHDLLDRRFDVVTLFRTVDHLLDVAAALRRARRLLNEDGAFFVDIVDFRATYLSHGAVEEAIKVDHPYYLTQLTMPAYLRRAGFEIIEVEEIADPPQVGYLCRPAPRCDDYLPEPAAVSAQWAEIRALRQVTGG